MKASPLKSGQSARYGLCLRGCRGCKFSSMAVVPDYEMDQEMKSVMCVGVEALRHKQGSESNYSV
jgi:hypothetical protein